MTDGGGGQITRILLGQCHAIQSLQMARLGSQQVIIFVAHRKAHHKLTLADVLQAGQRLTT